MYAIVQAVLVSFGWVAPPPPPVPTARVLPVGQPTNVRPWKPPTESK